MEWARLPVSARYAILPKHRQIECANMETITLADYVQYGFLAFIALLLVAVVVALIRQSGAIGELKGEVRGINLRLDEMSKSHSERTDAMSKSFSERLDEMSKSHSERTDATSKSFSERLDEMTKNHSERTDAMSKSFSERLDEMSRNFSERLDELRLSHSERMDALTTRVERLEDGLSALAREVSEIKGLLLALHQRVDLVMRHRHEPETGQVILTPEEIAAD